MLVAAHRAGRAFQERYRIYEADDLDRANEAPGRFTDLYESGPDPRLPRCLWTT